MDHYHFILVINSRNGKYKTSSISRHIARTELKHFWALNHSDETYRVDIEIVKKLEAEQCESERLADLQFSVQHFELYSAG